VEYVTEELDRSTGDLVAISLGDWITVTELGESYGVGPKQVRAILHHLGMLQSESGRYRLSPRAVEQGFGKRIEASKSRKYPFDVISPLGQTIIGQEWHYVLADLEAERTANSQVKGAGEALASFKQHRSSELTTQQEVCWLLDHFPDLLLEEIAVVLPVTRSLVSRYAKLRSRQLDYAKRLRARVDNLSEGGAHWPGADESDVPGHYDTREANEFVVMPSTRERLLYSMSLYQTRLS
jgi:hypothetical protein